MPINNLKTCEIYISFFKKKKQFSSFFFTINIFDLKSIVCMLSETLNVCLELLTTKQVSSLRLEHQKRNKGNDRLKDSRPEAVACDCHGDQTSARDVWRNSVHISQLS